MKHSVRWVFIGTDQGSLERIGRPETRIRAPGKRQKLAAANGCDGDLTALVAA
jgi:hypothetical protein